MKARAVYIDGKPVTIPLSDDAQRALSGVIQAHGAEVDAALAPFGLDRFDVMMPTFERVVREGESIPEPHASGPSS